MAVRGGRPPGAVIGPPRGLGGARGSAPEVCGVPGGRGAVPGRGHVEGAGAACSGRPGAEGGLGPSEELCGWRCPPRPLGEPPGPADPSVC